MSQNKTPWPQCPICKQRGRQEIMTRHTKKGTYQIMRYVHYTEDMTPYGQRSRRYCQAGKVVSEDEFSRLLGVAETAMDVL